MSRGIAALFALVLASPGLAHPDYESVERVLVDEAGRQVHLVKHFTDGIILSDPVKLVVRDGTGATLAETNYGWDVCVICWRQGRCLVFRYDRYFSPFPDDVWQLRGSKLIPASSSWLPWLAVLVPFWDHGGEFLLMLTIVLLPAAGLCYVPKVRDGFDRQVLSAVCLLLASFAALTLVVFMLAWRPSVPHRLAFLAIAAAACVWVGRRAATFGVRSG